MGELATRSELHVFKNIPVWYNQALLQFKQSTDIKFIISNPLILHLSALKSLFPEIK